MDVQKTRVLILQQANRVDKALKGLLAAEDNLKKIAATMKRPDNLKDEGVWWYKIIVDLHHDWYDYVSRVEDAFKRTSPEDMVDLGFMIREMETRFQDMRREATHKKELIGKLIAARVIQDAVQSGDPASRTTIKGEFASGSPDCKMQSIAPKRGTEEYIKFMAYLGVNEQAAQEQFLSVSWTGFNELVTRRFEEGKPLPPGCQEPKPVFTTTFRKNKNWTERIESNG